MITYSKQLPVIAEPDVLVCGAGLAGIGAAVAAARGGAKTMVIERNGFAGGFFTANGRESAHPENAAPKVILGGGVIEEKSSFANQ